MKLNLGCGTFRPHDYTNIDIKDGSVAYPLNVADGSCDEIRASHLLEHYPSASVQKVIAEWTAKLKPGGVLKIAVPDFAKITETYKARGPADMYQHIGGYVLGGQQDDNDYHKSLYDRDTLGSILQNAGLIDICEWRDTIPDSHTLPVSLNMQGRKPAAAVVTESADDRPIKIGAVMSMPRLAFTANMFCAQIALKTLGIDMVKGSGVFWGHVLTRCIQKQLDAGCDLILTIDYDTWFTSKHIERMAQLMVENPDVDAIVPVQTKRESSTPLLGYRFGEKNGTYEVPCSDFEVSLTKIESGHFGLTMLRADTLRKMPHPWFIAEPNKDGLWEEDRIEEDIYFWKKCKALGYKVCLANEVSIGHIQQMVTFPGTVRQNWAPTHVYINDVDEGTGIPKHCIPNVEYKS